MAIIEPQLDPPRGEPPLWRRLGWLGLYWSGGVLTLGAVALVLREIVR